MTYLGVMFLTAWLLALGISYYAIFITKEEDDNKDCCCENKHGEHIGEFTRKCNTCGNLYIEE